MQDSFVLAANHTVWLQLTVHSSDGLFPSFFSVRTIWVRRSRCTTLVYACTYQAAPQYNLVQHFCMCVARDKLAVDSNQETYVVVLLFALVSTDELRGGGGGGGARPPFRGGRG